MPSMKDLKKRIGTVKNTQQTTKAMKMVSAAKLRRAQEAITAQRPYARKIGTLIHKVAALQGSDLKSPWVRQAVSGEEVAGNLPKVLLVVVTSDRGLCGAFNSNAIKTSQRWIKANASSYSQVRVSTVGRKGFDLLKLRTNEFAENYPEAAGKVTFLKAKGLSSKLEQLFLNGDFDEVKFVYNEFKNAVTQKVVVEDFLPLNTGAVDPTAAEEQDAAWTLVKPNVQAVFDALLAKHFSAQVFRVLLESQAGEHGARMSSMDNATRTAGEMIRKLTLQYNKQRQAGITKELLEIISGSESQKESA